jgi:hypothetical protein
MDLSLSLSPAVEEEEDSKKRLVLFQTFILVSGHYVCCCNFVLMVLSLSFLSLLISLFLAPLFRLFVMSIRF